MKTGENKMYFTIIGDIISSKQMKNKERYDLQAKIDAVLSEINTKYKQDIAVDFAITLGDEFQGLLKNAESVIEITDVIKYKSEPTEIRFGIGVGDVFTDIHQNSNIKTDGPAFWHAKYAVKQMQENKKYNNPKIAFEAEEETAAWTNMINESLKLCDYMEKRWTEKQKNLIRESILRFGHDSERPQKELAEILGISTPAVNVHIKRSGYYNYLNLRKAIGVVIQKEWGNKA